MKPCAVPLIAVLAAASAVPCPAAVADEDLTPARAAVAAAAGEPSQESKIDEAALAILKRATDAIFALDRYQAECWTTFTYPPPADGRPAPGPVHEMATLTAVKPNLMRYDQWQMRVPAGAAAGLKTWQRAKSGPAYTFVVDGKTTWRQHGASHRRVDGTDLTTIQEPWTGFFSATHSPYEDADYYRIKGNLKEARRDGTAVVDGVPCHKVFTRTEGEFPGYRTTWYIGVKDGLVRRRAQWVLLDDGSGYLRDSTLRNIRTDGDVKTTPALFTYNPPAGVTLDED